MCDTVRGMGGAEGSIQSNCKHEGVRLDIRKDLPERGVVGEVVGVCVWGCHPDVPRQGEHPGWHRYLRPQGPNVTQVKQDLLWGGPTGGLGAGGLTLESSTDPGETQGQHGWSPPGWL